MTNEPNRHHSTNPAFSSEEVTSTTIDYSKLSNERLLILLNRYTGMSPYDHEFVPGVQDPQVVSGFISAMTSFMGEVTGSEQSRWKTEYGSESVLLVEGGDWIVGVLEVAWETNEARSKLRRVVKEFEDSFASLRYADGIEGGCFDEFDQFVRRVFLQDRLSERTIILKGNDWRDVATRYKRPSTAFTVTKFLYFIKNGQSLGEVSKSQGISLDDVKDLVMRALWHNAIFLSYVPSNNDILTLSHRSSSLLLKRDNPRGLSSQSLQVISSLDGRRPLSTFLETLTFGEAYQVLLELGDLINKGHIQRISLERRLVLVNECVLSGIIKECVRWTNPRVINWYFKTACKEGIEIHPWIGRIRLLDDLSVDVVLDDTMTPADLEDMYDAIEFIIENLGQQIAQTVGEEEAQLILSDARKRCHEKWGSFLVETTF